MAEDFSDLYLAADSPTCFDDFAYEDRSVLSLHIVSFNDATIVVLHWIHAAFDAMAKKAILQAWTQMLDGREDEIATPVSFREDPLRDVGKNPAEPHRLLPYKMSLFATIWWVLSNLLDLFWRAQETRVFCLPGSFVDGLRQRALSDLDTQRMGGDKQAEAWVSEGDVLVAWLAKVATCHHLNPDSTKKVRLRPRSYRH